MSDLFELDKKEKWAPVVGWEGLYEASTRGRIRSMPRKCYINRKQGYRGVPGGISTPYKNHAGYLFCQFSSPGRSRLMQIHRAVALAFLPNPDNKPFVNHKDGDKTNNRIENLEWVTFEENEAHALAAGLKCRGSKQGRAILTESDIPKIKKLIQRGLSFAEIGRRYGVGYLAISRISSGKAWTHVG